MKFTNTIFITLYKQSVIHNGLIMCFKGIVILIIQGDTQKKFYRIRTKSNIYFGTKEKLSYKNHVLCSRCSSLFKKIISLDRSKNKLLKAHYNFKGKNIV